jgi:glucokinase
VAALAEWRFGSYAGKRNLVYLTISTGIGGGVIMDGRMLIGFKGAGAELGHMILQAEHRLCWEELASGTGMARLAAAAMPQHPDSLLNQWATPATVTAAQVAQAADAGDALAMQLMARQSEYLGLGLVSTLHLFSPEVILVGGSVVTHNPKLLVAARRVVQERAIADVYRNVPIEVATLGNDVGVLGAAALVLYEHEVHG